MTGRDGNTPWEPPKDGNQWESSGGDSYGWRFPFRDDDGPNDSETAAMPTPGAPRPEPAHTAPSGAGTEYHPPSDAGSAYVPPSDTGTQETTSKPLGMGKGTVAALGVGAAVVAAAAGFGGGWFLQQPKIDEARNDASLLESQLNDSEETRTGSENSLSSLREDYKNALTASNGWPICNIAGYGDPSQAYWYFTSGDLEGLMTAAGVGCRYTVENTGQSISIVAGLSTEEAKKNEANRLEDGSWPDDKHGYRFVNNVDNGVRIIIRGPNETANKQMAEEVEGKLRALKDQTPSS